MKLIVIVLILYSIVIAIQNIDIKELNDKVTHNFTMLFTSNNDLEKRVKELESKISHFNNKDI